VLVRFQEPLKIGQGMIEVIDNGHGMSLETIQTASRLRCLRRASATAATVCHQEGAWVSSGGRASKRSCSMRRSTKGSGGPSTRRMGSCRTLLYLRSL
jgi:hypothetical protein